LARGIGSIPIRYFPAFGAGAQWRFALCPSFDTDGSGQDRLGHLVSNHLIRRALFEAVEGQAGLDLLTGVGIEAARTGADGARLDLADGRCLRGRLLVAADSRFSFVREQLGIGAQVNRLGRAMLVCRLAHEGDHEGVATEWFDDEQTIAMLPLGPGMSSAVLTWTRTRLRGWPICRPRLWVRRSRGGIRAAGRDARGRAASCLSSGRDLCAAFCAAAP
jgi:2-polyprenyl-6-methoxyphenol hydroxylase-like FAD-dependent oxidoreductase